MEFITKKDILMSIEEENLQEIICEREELLDDAEKRVLTSLKEYLGMRYDMEYELRPYSTNGTNGLIEMERYIENNNDVILVNGTSGILPDDRNYSLITITVDLFKYELFQRVAPRALNQIVLDRHDLAMKKLMDANRGKIQIDLKPLYNEESQNNRPFRHGKGWTNSRMKY